MQIKKERSWCMILANIELFKNNTIGVTLLMIVSMIIMYVLDMEYFGQ